MSSVPYAWTIQTGLLCLQVTEALRRHPGSHNKKLREGATLCRTNLIDRSGLGGLLIQADDALAYDSKALLDESNNL